MKKLYVVGIGAGNYDGMTVGAVKALEAADVIVGYTVYCDLVKPYFPDKEYLSTPMMREIERCRMALDCAADGKLTAMICSGDAGIYGMASPILELAGEYGVEVEIIAGVTAACSGAALLGSPLTCDFTVISLSDLLTPMEVIEKRIEGAAMSDICVVLYNPSSKKRADHLRRCCEILLKYRSADTVCGIAQNIGRYGECTKLLTLGELADYPADMFTTIFIGNSLTKIINGRMVTPRGYRHEQT
ncbi:MAG: precorrin-3B C(17)-methyltransferase [Clostridia bacterium]|nr:precorrin-3B C(17)-methyltransferase [Clostridia bacterium]